MPTFQYRALTPVGEVVTGSLDASSLAEVNRRVEYLGLIPIEAATARSEVKFGSGSLSSVLPSLTRPRTEDVTIFTADLALLLHTGARINDALELLAGDAEMSRMRPTAAAIERLRQPFASYANRYALPFTKNWAAAGNEADDRSPARRTR